MTDIEHARQLLRLAERDLIAMDGMDNRQVFADEIFGFQAQQAAEKTLKAWITAVGGTYPLRHDLAVLLEKLGQLGCDVADFWDLVDLTSFAVEFRYEELAPSEAIDRAAISAMVHNIFDHVAALVRQA